MLVGYPPQHTIYLAALPDHAPVPMLWSSELRRLLEGTELQEAMQVTHNTPPSSVCCSTRPSKRRRSIPPTGARHPRLLKANPPVVSMHSGRFDLVYARLGKA
jgi:hypothetical protein